MFLLKIQLKPPKFQLIYFNQLLKWRKWRGEITKAIKLICNLYFVCLYIYCNYFIYQSHICLIKYKCWLWPLILSKTNSLTSVFFHFHYHHYGLHM